MKVYVVTSGEYSDYRINAVFTDRRKAARFAAAENLLHKYCLRRIEEFETYDNNIDIESNGRRQVNYLYSYEEFYTPTFDPPETTYEDYHNGADFYRIVSPQPLSRAKLEKIVADLRTKYLAEKEGLT